MICKIIALNIDELIVRQEQLKMFNGSS